MSASHKSQISRLNAENAKLKKAIEGLICWAGDSPDGPEWATPEAKRRNREMLAKALEDAYACFPDDFDSFREIIKSN